MSGLLAALAALLAVGAAADAWASRGAAIRGALLSALRRRGIPARLDRTLAAAGGASLEARLGEAGLSGRLSPRALLAARLLTGLAAFPVSLVAARVAPGRVGILVALGVPAAAALVPDIVLARIGRRRRRRISRSLPDAMELMAVGAGAGRSHLALLADAAAASGGPLREELAELVARLRAGDRQAGTLAGVASRSGPELAGLATRLERSRRLGSPLARGLQEQAAEIREGEALMLTEEADRAAPKIQLVVALLLVPSVLLVVAAAILANLDALFIGL